MGKPLCNFDHAALKASLALWLALPLVGTQRFEGEALELRNCPHCRSTIAIEIVEEPALMKRSA